MKFQRQRGVVLVITLIMLSIITVMAVAFLALSRRERASVVHSQSSIDAELMASDALERVKAEILADIIGRTNLLGPDLLVSGSRTFVPPDPFLSGDAVMDPSASAATKASWKAEIWSLVNGSHPPVFVRTNLSVNSREH